MTLGNARSINFNEAFKHALNGEHVVKEDGACVCVPCRFVKWKHQQERIPFDEFSPIGTTLEGVCGQCGEALLPPSIGCLRLVELNHRLPFINAPPLLPPPRSFV